MTARQLIYSALRYIGVLRPGQGASDEAYADGLDMLNSMLDQWAIERLMIYSITSSDQDITANQDGYTIGTGGDWDIDRPVRVDRASVVLNVGDYPQEIPLEMLTYQQWQLVRVKTIPSTQPQMMYVDNGFPLMTAYLYPVPNGGQDVTIRLYLWNLLQSFENLDQDYQFPPGYDLALRFNLGEMLWPSFVVGSKSQANGMQLQMVQKMAAQAKRKVKVINNVTPLLRVDRSLRDSRSGWFDVRTNGGIS